MRIQSRFVRSHMMHIGFNADPNTLSWNHLQRWFWCALAFDPVSQVNHAGNYPRGCVIKHGTAGANSTQRVGLVEQSLFPSRLCFRRSRAQLNNKRTVSTARVNVGHFVTRSSCITISTYIRCALPANIKNQCEHDHCTFNALPIHCEHAF